MAGKITFSAEKTHGHNWVIQGGFESANGSTEVWANQPMPQRARSGGTISALMLGQFPRTRELRDFQLVNTSWFHLKGIFFPFILMRSQKEGPGANGPHADLCQRWIDWRHLRSVQIPALERLAPYLRWEAWEATGEVHMFIHNTCLRLKSQKAQ